MHFISTALCPENDSITLPCLCFRAQQSHKDEGQWRRPLPWSGMCQCGLGTWASKLILTNHFLGRQTNLNKPFSCRQGTLNGCVFFIASMQMCVATVQCRLCEHHKYFDGYHICVFLWLPFQCVWPVATIQCGQTSQILEWISSPTWRASAWPACWRPPPSLGALCSAGAAPTGWRENKFIKCWSLLSH